jgi:hypothetical protein
VSDRALLEGAEFGSIGDRRQPAKPSVQWL